MTNLAARIEAAYMKRTGKPTPRGARTWFARQARCHKQSVSRWIAGTVPFDGPPLAVLELLEAEPACAACAQFKADTVTAWESGDRSAWETAMLTWYEHQQTEHPSEFFYV